MTEVHDPIAAPGQPAQTADPVQAPPIDPQPAPVGPVSAVPASRGLVPGRRSVLKAVGVGLAVFVVTFALFVCFEVWVTGFIQSRNQSTLLSQFKASLVLPDTPALVAPPDGRPLGVIEIPNIGVTQMMVQGSSSADTELGPGHDPATPAPGQVGNAVVIGRSTTYGGPFADLGRLQTGDKITILTRQGQFIYTVTANQVMPLGSLVPVANIGTVARLTLITASGSVVNRRETVVRARLSSPGLAVPRVLPARPAGQQPGLSADTAHWGWILVWGELLLMSIGVTWYMLRRRWNPGVTYLLAVPVLLTLGFLMFQAADNLLPPAW